MNLSLAASAKGKGATDIIYIYISILILFDPPCPGITAYVLKSVLLHFYFPVVPPYVITPSLRINIEPNFISASLSLKSLTLVTLVRLLKIKRYERKFRYTQCFLTIWIDARFCYLLQRRNFENAGSGKFESPFPDFDCVIVISSLSLFRKSFPTSQENLK